MNSKNIIKILSIIHAIFCLNLVVFGAYIYIQNESFSSTVADTGLFIYLVPVAAIICYFASKYIFQVQIQKISKVETLHKKLQHYQGAYLILYVLLEGPSFLALIAYYIGGNPMHFVVAISLLVYLFFQRPTFEKLKQELQLSLDEEKEFNTLNKK